MAQHTIYDIARLAGVSGKTVSRVLNKEPGVAEPTRNRVLRLIEQLGYQPHHGARSMRGQRRDCVGVIFSAPMHVVPTSQQQINWLFLELYRVFGKHGKFICFDLNPYEDGEEGTDYARALWQQRCNGCVVHGALPVGDKTIHRIHKSGHPYMALNRLDDLPELCYACVDYEQASYLSTQHLIQRGHKRIGMLQAFSTFQAGIERRRGYCRAMYEAGLSVDERLIQPVGFNGTDVVSATRRLLAELGATAIVDCSMLEDPAHFREGARRAGRRPGQDFDLVDWTYSANASVLPEACAHLWLPLREAASEGIELLAKWFDKEREEPFQILYTPWLQEAVEGREFRAPTPIFDTLR